MLNTLFGKAPSAPAAGRRPPLTGLIERDGQCVSADEGLLALAAEGWAIKGQIDDLKARLDGITDALQNSLGAGAALVVDGQCRVALAERLTYALKDVERCKGLLGGRFDDLVAASVTYTLTDKLKELVQEAEHPLVKSGLDQCIAIKRSMSVTFRPVKP
jgi:hypothetical protein